MPGRAGLTVADGGGELAGGTGDTRQQTTLGCESRHVLGHAGHVRALLLFPVPSRVLLRPGAREPVAPCTQRTPLLPAYRQVDACSQHRVGACCFIQCSLGTSWRVCCRFGAMPPMPSLSILSISTASPADACKPLNHPVRPPPGAALVARASSTASSLASTTASVSANATSLAITMPRAADFSVSPVLEGALVEPGRLITREFSFVYFTPPLNACMTVLVKPRTSAREQRHVNEKGGGSWRNALEGQLFPVLVHVLSKSIRVKGPCLTRSVILTVHPRSPTVVQVVGAVIVDQGVCSFATKAWHAQSAGATQVIIQAIGDGTTPLFHTQQDPMKA